VYQCSGRQLSYGTFKIKQQNTLIEPWFQEYRIDVNKTQYTNTVVFETITNYVTVRALFTD
jgi:hypothetical protein